MLAKLDQAAMESPAERVWPTGALPRLLWFIALSLLLHVLLLMQGGVRDRPVGPSPQLLNVSIQPVRSVERFTAPPIFGDALIDKEAEAIIPAETPPVVDLSSPQVQERVVAQPKAYVSAFALTKKPVFLNPDWLDEVVWRLPAQVSGHAAVTLYIDVNGKVTDVGIDDAASSEFAEWLIGELKGGAKFAPGYVGDVAVNSKLKLQLQLDALVR